MKIGLIQQANQADREHNLQRSITYRKACSGWC